MVGEEAGERERGREREKGTHCESDGLGAPGLEPRLVDIFEHADHASEATAGLAKRPVVDENRAWGREVKFGVISSDCKPPKRARVSVHRAARVR